MGFYRGAAILPISNYSDHEFRPKTLSLSGLPTTISRIHYLFFRPPWALGYFLYDVCG
jgi:hypothetical protein